MSRKMSLKTSERYVSVFSVSCLLPFSFGYPRWCCSGHDCYAHHFDRCHWTASTIMVLDITVACREDDAMQQVDRKMKSKEWRPSFSWLLAVWSAGPVEAFGSNMADGWEGNRRVREGGPSVR